MLRAARRNGHLPDIGEIGRPPIRPLSADSWELASGSEALLYFEQDEVKGLSLHYGQVARIADRVLAEFLGLVRGEGSAALVATHNERLAAKMDRVVRLHEGHLE